MPRVHFADEFQPDFGLPWRPVLTQEQVKDWDDERLARYIGIRKQVEADAIKNPVGQGWVLPMWQRVMQDWKKYQIIILLGGNRSTRSTFCARLTTWAACTIPEAEVRAYHVNEERSRQEQQRYIWESIPLGIKNLPKSRAQHLNLQYSQLNGFTGEQCIFPPLPGYRRGGYISFGNYRQFQQDPQVTEGFKSHLIWGDEEMPHKMLETLIYRTIDYHGRIILSFTTLQGWTPLIQDFLSKTRTIEKKYAPLAGRDVPIVQESLSRPGTGIFFFHTEDNPFIDVEDFRTKVKSRKKEEILARAYGIPSKSISGVFAGFDKEVNVIPHDSLPWIKNPKYKVTRYMAIDPAGSKNWFMAWVAIDAAGTWWIYQEWPDFDDWALPGSTAEGKPGPAQKGSKKGIRDYVELVKGIEGETEIYERYIDPRLGAAEKQSEDGATTIISDLDDQNMTVIPAPGVDIENGIQLINNLLSWDDNKPRDSLNAPKLYVSDRCQNIIHALAEYTGQGGRQEATKDPIDCLRYLAVSNIQFVETTHNDPQMAYGRTGSY